MTWFKTCTAFAAAAVLAGCAAFGPPRPPAPRAPAFDLIGRVAVNYDGRAFSSGVRWQHLAERDEIWLLTPLGQALGHIVGDADGALFTAADRSQYRAGDIGSLTRRALGWELPVERLAWWVRGEAVADGAIEDVARDPRGRLIRLRQDGWEITYAYRSPEESDSLPQRLELVRDTHNIRLLIDNWRVGDTP
jgi:outer membrane lipoprotein LolB